MPTTYKAEIDVPEFDVDGWLSRRFGNLPDQSDDCPENPFVEQLSKDLAEIPGKLRLELSEFHYEELQHLLVTFALNIVAEPHRTLNQLLPTIREIHQFPERLLDFKVAFPANKRGTFLTGNKYPILAEAVARVLHEIERGGKNLHPLVAAWETGSETLDRKQFINLVRDAAARVIEQFERGEDATEDRQTVEDLAPTGHGKVGNEKKAQNAGRRPHRFRAQLAHGLARVFLSAGGQITRRVKKDGTESGDFHQFLAIVLKPLKEPIKFANIHLNVNTMVRESMKTMNQQKAKPPN